jgi:Tol biopolymer transport system component
MAFVPAGGGSRQDTLVWVDRSGAEQPTTVTGPSLAMPRVAPDERRVAVATATFTAPQGNQGDLWIYDLMRGTSSRVTFDGFSTFPIWDPRGTRLVLSSGQTGKYQVLIKTLDGTAPDVQMPTERGTNYPLSWSPDGRFIAAVSVETDTANDIWVLTLDNPPTWRPFVQTKYREGAPTFSHDGRLLAYASDHSGRSEIYVRPFPGPGEPVTISNDGGNEPVFARAAPTLFYRQGNDVVAVDISAGPPIEVGPLRRMRVNPYTRSNGFWPNYDVTPDGRRLLMIRSTAREVPSRVNIVLNWLDAK